MSALPSPAMAALRHFSLGPLLPAAPRTLPPLLARLRQRPLLPLALRIPTPAVTAIAGVAGVLSGLWESILRAVPKKKTSHMKKRHRQMAGKALKDVSEVVKCPGCGRPKRAHILCPYCIQCMSLAVPGTRHPADNARSNPAVDEGSH